MIEGNTVLKFPFQHSCQYNCSCFYQSDPPYLCGLSFIATGYAMQNFLSSIIKVFITCVLWTSTSISIAIVFERRLCSHGIFYLSVLADLDITCNLNILHTSGWKLCILVFPYFASSLSPWKSGRSGQFWIQIKSDRADQLKSEVRK